MKRRIIIVIAVVAAMTATAFADPELFFASGIIQGMTWGLR